MDSVDDDELADFVLAEFGLLLIPSGFWPGDDTRYVAEVVNWQRKKTGDIFVEVVTASESHRTAFRLRRGNFLFLSRILQVPSVCVVCFAIPIPI